MGLIDLLKYVSPNQKNKILGKETTKIIRFSFVRFDYEALPIDILNEAVALYAGIELVNTSKGREMLVEALPINILENMGINGANPNEIFDKAVQLYKRDVVKFFTDFEIEDDYRKITEIDERANFEFTIPVYGESNGVSAFPHLYQLRVKKELMGHLRAPINYNTNKSLVTMPTGAGKTVLAMETIVDLFRGHFDEKPLNILWLVNSQELCEQSLIAFQKLWKQKGDRKIMAQRYYDKFNSLNFENVDKITFASFTLLTPRIVNKTSEDLKLLKMTDYLFIDEAHFANADEYQNVFRSYVEQNSNPKIVGLTATPIRSDDDQFVTLKSMFNYYLKIKNDEGMDIDSPIEYLQNLEYLSKIDFQVINNASERIGQNLVDYSGYYNELHSNIERVCNTLIKNGQNTIIFAESRSHAIALSLFLKSRNVENELIVGATPTLNRKKYLERLEDKSDSLSIIVNEKILSTGIDIKGLNSIIVLCKIESVTTALQILGRAMRGPKNGGNQSNTIYLTRDNRTKLENLRLLEARVINN